MPFLVHPIRPDILPDDTRHVTVGGKTLPVSVTFEDHGYLATHGETGCWGYGPTVDEALADVALMLANDRDWYCFGTGKTLYLYGRAYHRRAAIQKVFGEGA